MQTSLIVLLAGSDASKAERAVHAEAAALLQEHWAYTAAQVAKLDVERKESVLPGSAAQQEEVLFGSDEVKEVQSKRKILDMRRGTGASGTTTGPTYSFRPSAAGASSGKGGKGAKGHGGRVGWNQ